MCFHYSTLGQRQAFREEKLTLSETHTALPPKYLREHSMTHLTRNPTATHSAEPAILALKRTYRKKFTALFKYHIVISPD